MTEIGQLRSRFNVVSKFLRERNVRRGKAGREAIKENKRKMYFNRWSTNNGNFIKIILFWIADFRFLKKNLLFCSFTAR
jgi:hypothetical protein